MLIALLNDPKAGFLPILHTTRALGEMVQREQESSKEALDRLIAPLNALKADFSAKAVCC